MQYYIEKIFSFMIISAIAATALLLIEKFRQKKETRIVIKHIITAMFIAYLLILLDTTIIDSRHFFRVRMIDFTPFDNLLRFFNTYNPRESELLLRD